LHQWYNIILFAYYIYLTNFLSPSLHGFAGTTFCEQAHKVWLTL